MISRGRDIPTTQTIHRLMFEPQRKKVYLSFPMSHVMDQPATLREIEQFKKSMHQHFVCFDPGDVDESLIYTAGEKAQQESRSTVQVPSAEGTVTLKTSDAMQIAGDIMGQIYA